MAKNGVIIVEGEIIENLPNAMFRVELNEKYGGSVILCHLSGKIRMNFIKFYVGDKVRVEMSPYDLERGRITYRIK